MRNFEVLSRSSQEWLSYREPANKLIHALAKRALTLSVIDGCKGYILDQLTIPGATRAFRMGTVVSSWDAKLRLGVPETLMNEWGEFSPEVAKCLAELALNFHHDSVALSVTGEYVSLCKKGQRPWVARMMGGSPFSLSQQAISQAYMYVEGRHTQGHGNHLLKFVERPGSVLLPDQVQMASVINQVLHNSSQKVATMESCTGGALARAFDNLPFSPLDTAWVTYDEDAKMKLGVPISALAYGSVYSERVALAMAEAMQKITGVEIALATTGAMDTADTRPFHTDTKPGTVYIALLIKGKKPYSEKLQVPILSREEMKDFVVKRVLNVLYELLFKAQLKEDPRFYLKY